MAVAVLTTYQAISGLGLSRIRRIGEMIIPRISGPEIPEFPGSAQ